MSRYYWAGGLTFEEGVLRVRLRELLEGPEDSLIGRPLQVLSGSPTFEVLIEQVGNFQVRPEPMGALSANADRLHEFLFREVGTEFQAQHEWGAKTMAIPRLRREAAVMHYVVYAENYVVDVLASHEPVVIELKNAAA